MKAGGRSKIGALPREAFCILHSAFFLSRKQPAQIAITAGRFDVEQERLIAQVQLGAKDGLNAGLLGGLHELGRPVQIPGVGQRHRRTPMPRRQCDDGFRRQCRIEERIVAVNPQGNVGKGRRLNAKCRNRFRRSRHIHFCILPSAFCLQDKVVSAQDGRVAARATQFVHHAGEPLAGFPPFRPGFERQLIPEKPVVNVG